MQKVHEWFRAVAEHAAALCGSLGVFFGSCALIVLWLVSGPLFGWSDTWQLIVNTATTVVTFLMAFLIQYTQNRDNRALHIKMDGLIEASEASNKLIDLQHMPDEAIERAYNEMLRRRNQGNERTQT